MITKKVTVTQEIEVTVDESRFGEDFMSVFRDVFYDFDSIDEHIEHIAQCAARGIVQSQFSFLEGYGTLKDAGISFKELDVETEIQAP